MGKKIKSKVFFECCENGVMITIKKGKEVLGVKVFEDYKNIDKGISWIKNVLEKNNKKEVNKK